MSNSSASRRSFLAASLAAGASLALTGPTHALTTQQAAALIDQVVSDINQVINSGRSEAQMLREFERIFARYGDVPIIARSALGAAARTASGGQIAAFTDAFSGYISRKYGRRFREFIGGEIKVQQARPYKNFFEVRTVAYLRGREPLEVIFLVSDRSGRNLFFNIFVEGVNMLASERTEIGAMLDQRRGNIDALTADLRKMG
ncbi:MlaC/ttg2D family ABC transporter substrate-binding protein [Rhodovulum adriaticum]|uniref:Phospholipid transport system substrate-binding protein n=1 Tax=Rhodovulum adriaticum TaxID=35804 RepID=A0A4R2NYN1_RHOAD|nr:ABC transporter substrate-binding protein [Rhodovulum adriaticum]MBK1634922.1 ABC transporter [Rhodovulum adriaticum]TCP27393.1 phospholipid transport system substrate-binding protein [Rhodovulum adriaticum]